MSHGAAAVDARGLAHLYDQVRGLRGLDLRVAPGECVALIGHNGSGKTTALQCIAGHLSPTSGWVRVCGADPFTEPDAIRARRSLAFVGDAPVFYRSFTVAEHLELVGAAHGVIDALGRRAWASQADRLVDAFGLGAHRDAFPHQLSAGLRQRTQLACAFARPFEVLVLDEPTLRLDPAGQQLVAERVQASVAEGAAVLFATHALDLVRQLALRVVLLEDGTAAAAGDWATIRGEVARRLGPPA